jgi:hypothetical protein
VTKPVRVEEIEVLQPTTSTLQPWWSTFTGHTAGVWCGKYGAFSMASGQLEPLTKHGGKLLKELCSDVVERVLLWP